MDLKVGDLVSYNSIVTDRKRFCRITELPNTVVYGFWVNLLEDVDNKSKHLRHATNMRRSEITFISGCKRSKEI